jgi:DNA-binding beta-propeller fold protein YncE
MMDGKPRHVALDQAGNLLLVDLDAPYVDVLDYRGESLARLELPSPHDDFVTGTGAGALTVEGNGNILVATRGKDGRIFRFSADYELVDSWGVPGTEPGQLSQITAMAILPDGNVIVACEYTELVLQIFTPAGEFVQGFGTHDTGAGNFSLPSGVAVTGDGRIWVLDQNRQVIEVFESNGSYVGRLGSGGREAGEFLYPSALATDGASLLAVAEKAGNRLQLFRIRGTGTSDSTRKGGSTF